MCVTLNEGYLRSANRGSNNFIQIFNQNITYQPSMKKRIFLVCLFYCFFFRLPIYESIAAIFWQSASYVLFFVFPDLWLQLCFIVPAHLWGEELYTQMGFFCSVNFG